MIAILTSTFIISFFVSFALTFIIERTRVLRELRSKYPLDM
jgi:hypothetical protein